MNTHAEKSQKNKSQSLANSVTQKKQNSSQPTFQFADNRPETIAQGKLQKMTIESPQAKQAFQLQAIVNQHSENPIQRQGIEEELLQGKFLTIQKQGIEEEELLQGKFEPIQKKGIEEEEPLQGKFHTVQKQGIEEEELLQGKFNPIQKKENNTGIPDNLKSGIESLSGYSLDDVNVNFNSDKPAQLNAFAYAQGTDIHIAPGQEKHLPHEAWHVVQQKQGRVKPTMQMKGNVNVNDDAGLEKEADQMGAKAFHLDDNLPMEITQRKLQKMKDNSQQVSQKKALPEIGNKSQNDKQATQLEAIIQKVSFGTAAKPTPTKQWEIMGGFVSKHLIDDSTEEAAKAKWTERWNKTKDTPKNTVVATEELKSAITSGNVEGTYPKPRGPRGKMTVMVKGYTVKRKFGTDIPNNNVQELTQIGVEGTSTDSLFFPDHLDPENSK